MAGGSDGAQRPDDDSDVVPLGSVLGWGGVVVRPDGSTAPIPEHEALAVAIAEWVHFSEHVDDAIAICLGVVTRPEPVVRAAVVRAFGAIAQLYGRLPQEQAVRQAVTRALDDPDDEVRQAAVVAQRAIEQSLDSGGHTDA